MLYDVATGVLFLHVPRTGGTSIMTALARVFPYALVDNYEGKHEGAAYWLDELGGPDIWARMRYRFCVVRNPWDLVESDYRNTLRAAKLMSRDPLFRLRVPMEYQSYIVQVERFCDLDAFFRQIYEREGKYLDGLWRTYCTDHLGRELGVDTIRYEELAEAWPAICRRIGRHVPLAQLNAGGHHEDPRVRWTPDLVDRVGRFFADDVERFGWNLTHEGKARCH